MNQIQSAMHVLATSVVMLVVFSAPIHAAHLAQPDKATDYTILWILGLTIAGIVGVGALASIFTRSRRRLEPTRQPRPIDRPEHRNDAGGGG
jgi:hypothetical protein